MYERKQEYDCKRLEHFILKTIKYIERLPKDKQVLESISLFSHMKHCLAQEPNLQRWETV